jgi:Ca2+-binding RTX toxin-like protein
VLLGGDADDYLEGGAGHDELYGQAGSDALFGLTGNDRLFADDAAADTVRGGPGDDSGNVDDEDDVLDVEALT